MSFTAKRRAPRTNPGPDPENWERGQYDQNSKDRATPTSIEDKQAPRMAYMANAAICPRNKFNKKVLPGALRFNRFVVDAEIKMPGNTILVTEFHEKWQNVTMPDSLTGLPTCKSHRSLNPFCSLRGQGSGKTGEGYEYDITPGTVTFIYGTSAERNEPFGLKTTKELEELTNLISGDRYPQMLNVVGRHHPGGTGDYAGTANFLYCDGHVSRKSVLETMTNREWGDKYYSLTGETGVIGRGEIYIPPAAP